MKIKRLQRYSGFTLIELLVSMTITVVLLGVLVYLTAISMDTYRDSRNEVRATRQAKEAIEAIAKDFESMVSRRDGNVYEWLYAGDELSALKGPANKEITNTSQLIFFTGATDRYNGQIGTAEDKGGDVSAVGYRLVYKDQISGNNDYAVFSLYRHLINPDETFENLLAVSDIDDDPDNGVEDGLFGAYTSNYDDGDDLSSSNFLVENIYELTITFLVEYTTSGATPVTRIERVSLMQNSTGGYKKFRLKGNAMETDPVNADIVNGSIVGVEVSISVLTDRGMTIAKKSGMSAEQWEKEVKKHSYHYTKTITTPRP